MEAKDAVISRMVSGKAERRRRQAALSFADKIRSLVRMQKLAGSLQSARSNPVVVRVWGED